MQSSLVCLKHGYL